MSCGVDGPRGLGVAATFLAAGVFVPATASAGCEGWQIRAVPVAVSEAARDREDRLFDELRLAVPRDTPLDVVAPDPALVQLPLAAQTRRWREAAGNQPTFVLWLDPSPHQFSVTVLSFGTGRTDARVVESSGDAVDEGGLASSMAAFFAARCQERAAPEVAPRLEPESPPPVEPPGQLAPGAAPRVEPGPTQPDEPSGQAGPPGVATEGTPPPIQTGDAVQPAEVSTPERPAPAAQASGDHPLSAHPTRDVVVPSRAGQPPSFSLGATVVGSLSPAPAWFGGPNLWLRERIVGPLGFVADVRLEAGGRTGLGGGRFGGGLWLSLLGGRGDHWFGPRIGASLDGIILHVDEALVRFALPRVVAAFDAVFATRPAPLHIAVELAALPAGHEVRELGSGALLWSSGPFEVRFAIAATLPKPKAARAAGKIAQSPRHAPHRWSSRSQTPSTTTQR